MYGENSSKLRAELTTLLHQHRIQQRLGGPGTYTVPETTTIEERKELGEQIAHYRTGALTWCLQAVHTTIPGINPARTHGPTEDLRHRLDAAIKHSAAGLPTLADLTSEQRFPMVETWRQAARAAALGEHDFGAGLGQGRLSTAQCRTVLKDAAEVTRALVGLDRRYSNIPDWQLLKNPGRLEHAAEVCATFAGHHEPDYAVDLRGWRSTSATVEDPGRPGVAGVLQAEHNLLAHLAKFPDARSLRVVLNSQHLVSHHAAALVEPTDPESATKWRTRATTYAQLTRETRDLGGHLGNGGPAASQSAIAASRIQRLTTTDLTDPTAARQLDRLFASIDNKITQIIEHGAKERLYFLRVPFPRIDQAAAGLVKPTRERYTPITSPVQTDLLQTVRTQLRHAPDLPKAPDGAAQSRAEFEAAIVHRPAGRAGPGMAM